MSLSKGGDHGRGLMDLRGSEQRKSVLRTVEAELDEAQEIVSHLVPAYRVHGLIRSSFSDFANGS